MGIQFAIRTNAKRKCSMEEALAICIRANVAACKRYRIRVGPLECDDLDLLQETALPSALRTLDTHLIFEGVEFNRHVKAFEKGKQKEGYKLPKETFASKKEYPIKRIAYDKDDHNINEFLSEFVMNALFIRLTGSTKYLMQLIKEKDSTLPGMDLNKWKIIFEDLEKQTTSAPFINSQWTSKFSNLRESIRRFMVDIHEQLLEDEAIKSHFNSRVNVFSFLNNILDNEFVTSLIIGDIDEFFSGIFDEIPITTVKNGYGGGDGKSVIDNPKKKVEFEDILAWIEDGINKQRYDDRFVNLLGFENDNGILRNVCNGRQLSLVDIEHFSCKMFLFCDHLYGNRIHAGTDTTISKYLHPIEFENINHPFDLVEEYQSLYYDVANELTRVFEDYRKDESWTKLNLPRPMHNKRYIDDYQYPEKFNYAKTLENNDDDDLNEDTVDIKKVSIRINGKLYTNITQI